MGIGFAVGSYRVTVVGVGRKAGWGSVTFQQLGLPTNDSSSSSQRCVVEAGPHGLLDRRSENPVDERMGPEGAYDPFNPDII